MTGRILVLMQDGDARQRLAAQLEAAYLEVLPAENAGAALASARGAGPGPAPDIVLASAEAGGLSLCRRLKAEAETAHLPAILIAPRAARQTRLAGLEAGADDILAPETPERELSSRLRRLLRSKGMLDELRLREETALALSLPAPPEGWAGRWAAAAETPGRLLVVADAVAAGRRRAAQLAAALGVEAAAARPADSLAEAEATAPDLVLLELDGPSAEPALRLIAALRARPALRETGLIVVLPEGTADTEDAAARALDLGAGDAAPAPPDMPELAARLRAELRRRRRAAALRATLRDGLMLAARDPLTGLHNRRYAEPHLARLLTQCRTAGRPLAVLLLDLDRFKAINDRHGHAAGDAVLRGVAERLKAGTRSADLVARIGGEEFCIALPETGPEAARAAAERLRAAIAVAPFATPAGALHATASLGVAVALPPDPQRAEEPIAAEPPPAIADEVGEETECAARRCFAPDARAADRQDAPSPSAPATPHAALPRRLAASGGRSFLPQDAPSAPALRAAGGGRPQPSPGFAEPPVAGLARPGAAPSMRPLPAVQAEAEAPADADALLAAADHALYASKAEGRNRVSMSGDRDGG